MDICPYTFLPLFDKMRCAGAVEHNSMVDVDLHKNFLEILKDQEPDVLLEPGQTLFIENDEASTAYVLSEGTIDLSIRGSALRTLLPNDIMGEMALIDNSTRFATATAGATGARLYSIDGNEFLDFVKNKPKFAIEVMKVMAKRLRSWSNHVDLRELFGRYTSDEVVKRILEHPEGREIGGDKRKVSIVMADLRGFSSLSEKFDSETVMKVLNSYLETMTNIVVKYDGFISEILGDGILILFGAPTIHDDDTLRAVACSLEMMLAMSEVNENNKKLGLPQLEMGIGVNTGEVVAGNIGSVKRAKYTVVGSSVNMAGRIESFTVGGQILISESTLNDLSGIAITGKKYLLPFKGFKNPVEIFELTGLAGKHNLILPDDKLELVTLKMPFKMEYSLLESKVTAGPWLPAELTAISDRYAVAKISSKLDALSNLKLRRTSHCEEQLESELFCKVSEGHDSDPMAYLLRFTSLPADVKRLIEMVNKA